MKTMKRIILIMFVAILVFSPANVAVTEHRETLEGRRIELQEQMLERNLEMEALQSRITDTLAEISGLDERIGTHQNELTILNSNLIRVNREIEEAEEELARAQESYETQKEIFQQRLIAQYMAGDTRYLDVLLSSSSIMEFISNYFFIAEIAEHDATLLNAIERQKNRIESITETLAERREALRALSDNEQRTIVALENTRVIRNSYVERLSAEERAVQSQIDEFRQSLDAVEREILALSVANIDGDFVGGEFAWPAPGNYRITSRFGMRIHPIFRYSRMHSGLDIGTPMGAPIVAANDGIVIRSTYAVGYGNMVMIDHGGGVVTVYGHGSRLIANVGDRVSRGDVIMLAGSTGWSTGPHLHFEIRVNGRFIDPLPHITRRATLQTSNTNNTEETNEN